MLFTCFSKYALSNWIFINIVLVFVVSNGFDSSLEARFLKLSHDINYQCDISNMNTSCGSVSDNGEDL